MDQMANSEIDKMVDEMATKNNKIYFAAKCSTIFCDEEFVILSNSSICNEPNIIIKLITKGMCPIANCACSGADE